MTRLNILVEGQTELAFVKDVIAPHLAEPFHVIASPCLITTSRNRTIGKVYKGGVSTYEKLRRELCNWIKHERRNDCLLTSMFDLYTLPSDFSWSDGKPKVS